MSRKATAAARRTRCRTASVPMSAGAVGSADVGAADARPCNLGHLHPEQSGQLFAQPAHAGPQRLHAQPAAGGAHDRPHVATARAAQDLLVTRLRRGGAAPRAAGQLPAMAARQQPSPTGAVVDAHQGSPFGRRGGIVEHGPGEAHELLGEQARPGVGTAAVDPFERRPPGPLLGCRHRLDGELRAPGERHRRDGRDQDARGLGASGPLEQHVDRAVRRRALLPVGRVMGIEHDRGGEPRHRGPGAGAAPHDDRPAGPRLVPRTGGRAPPPDQARRQALRPAGGGDEHDDAAPRGADPGLRHDRQHEVDQVGGRRQADDRGARPGGRTVPCGHLACHGRDTGHRGRGQPGGGAGSARTTIGGDAACRKNEAGPAQRQAAHSARSTSSGGGPQPNHDLAGRTATPGGGSTSSSTTQPRTVRPCRGTRTRVPTTTSSDHSGGTA